MTGITAIILQSLLLCIIVKEKAKANQSPPASTSIIARSMNYTVNNLMGQTSRPEFNSSSYSILQGQKAESIRECIHSEVGGPSQRVTKLNSNVKYSTRTRRSKGSQQVALFVRANSAKGNKSVNSKHSMILSSTSTESLASQKYTKEIHINKNAAVNTNPTSKSKISSPEASPKGITTQTETSLKGSKIDPSKNGTILPCSITYHRIINISEPMIPASEKKKSMIDGFSINKQADEMNAKESKPTNILKKLTEEEKELAKKNNDRKSRQCPPYTNRDRLREFRLMHGVYNGNEEEMEQALRTAHMHIQSVANEFNPKIALKSGFKNFPPCIPRMMADDQGPNLEITSEKLVKKRRTDQPETSPLATQVTAPYQNPQHETTKMFPTNKLETLVDEIRRRQEELTILQQIFDKERKNLDTKRSSERLKKSKAILHQLFGSSPNLLKNRALPVHLNEIITPRSLLNMESELMKPKIHLDSNTHYLAPGRIEDYDATNQQNKIFTTRQRNNLTMMPVPFKISSYINNKNNSSFKYSIKPSTGPIANRPYPGPYYGPIRKKRGLSKEMNDYQNFQVSKGTENMYPAGNLEDAYERSNEEHQSGNSAPLLRNLSNDIRDSFQDSLNKPIMSKSNNFSISSLKPSRHLEKRWIFSGEKQLTTQRPCSEHSLIRRLAQDLTTDLNKNDEQSFNETTKLMSQAEISADKIKKELSDDYCSKFANLHNDLLDLEKSIQSLKRGDIEGDESKTDSGSVVIQVNVSVEVLNGTTGENKNMIGTANKTLKVRKCGRTVVSLSKPIILKKEESIKEQAPVTCAAKSAKIASSKPVGHMSRNHHCGADTSSKEVIKSAGIFTWVKSARSSGRPEFSNEKSFFKPLKRLRRNGASKILQKTNSFSMERGSKNGSVSVENLAKKGSSECRKNLTSNQARSKCSVAHEFSVSLKGNNFSKLVKRKPMSFTWTNNDSTKNVTLDKIVDTECTEANMLKNSKQWDFSVKKLTIPNYINPYSRRKGKVFEITRDIQDRCLKKDPTERFISSYNEENVNSYPKLRKRFLSVNLKSMSKTNTSKSVTEKNIISLLPLKPTVPMKTKKTEKVKNSSKDKINEHENYNLNSSLDKINLLFNHSNSAFLSKVRKKRMLNSINENDVYSVGNEFDIVLNHSKSKIKTKLPILWVNQYNSIASKENEALTFRPKSRNTDKFQSVGELIGNNLEMSKKKYHDGLNKKLDSSKPTYVFLKKPLSPEDQTGGKYDHLIYEVEMSQSKFKPISYPNTDSLEFSNQNICTKRTDKKVTLSEEKKKFLTTKQGHSKGSKYEWSLTNAIEAFPTSKLLHNNVTILGPGNRIEQEGINLVKFPRVEQKEKSSLGKDVLQKKKSLSLLCLKPGEYLLLSSGNKHVKLRLGGSVTSSPLNCPDEEEMLSLITKKPKVFETVDDSINATGDISGMAPTNGLENATDKTIKENIEPDASKDEERTPSKHLNYKELPNQEQDKEGDSNDDMTSSPEDEDSILDLDTLTMEDDKSETWKPSCRSKTDHELSNKASKDSKIRFYPKAQYEHTPLKWLHSENFREKNKKQQGLCHRSKSSNLNINNGISKYTNWHKHYRLTPSPVTETLYFAGYTIKIGSTSPKENINPTLRALEPEILEEKVNMPSMKVTEHDSQKKYKGNKKNNGHQILFKIKKKKKRMKVLEQT